MKFKNSRKGKNPLAIVASCILVFAVLAGLTAFSNYRNQDTKIITPSFEVGGLDTATGKFVDTDGSIYTKESFECQGLIVKLDFDSTVQYQVFYYDDVDEYIGVCSPVYDNSVELAVPSNAVYARIMVTPIWDEDVADDDRVCHWYDVAKYASQLEITVNKDQDLESCEHVYENGECTLCGDQLTNLFSEDKWTSAYYYASGELILAGSEENPYAYANLEENIKVKPGDIVQSNIFYFTTSYNGATCIRIAGFDAEGNYVTDVLTPASVVPETGWVVPEGIYQLNIPVWADHLESEEVYIYVWEK